MLTDVIRFRLCVGDVVTLAVPTWQRPNPSRNRQTQPFTGRKAYLTTTMASRTSQKTTQSMRRTFCGHLGRRPRGGRSPAVGRGSHGWQRFSGKGKGKSKGKSKDKGKGKNKGNNLSVEERKKRLAEVKSRTNCQACGARGHWAGDDICPKNAKSDGSPQPPTLGYLALGGETPGFDLALLGVDSSADATALVAHARLDASDIPVDTPPKAPPGARRPRKPPRVFPSPPSPTPQCAGGCKKYSRRGTNATVERFTCVDCGFVIIRVREQRRILLRVPTPKRTRGAVPRRW